MLYSTHSCHPAARPGPFCAFLWARVEGLGAAFSKGARVIFGTLLAASSSAMILSISLNHLVEGSLEVKLPTIWTDEKQSREEAERRGRLEERRVEEKE